MLTLPIKAKWYEMIVTGDKKEEYREITPYYTARFMKLFGVDPDAEQKIRFRNGYSKDSPTITALCTLSRRGGKQRWGAEPKKDYFVLNIIDITS